MEVLYFLLGVVVYQLFRMLAKTIEEVVVNRRRKKFLKLVMVLFPDHQDITLIALDTSDRRAMQKLERQLREEYDVPEDEMEGLFDGDENRYRNR